MKTEEAISISETETLRAMVFTEHWGLSDIAYRKGVYDADETYLEKIWEDITNLEIKSYLRIYECSYDLFSDHFISISYNYTKCEQLLGITRNMFFENGIRYEKVDCAKCSITGYTTWDEGSNKSLSYHALYIKRNNKWLYMKEFQMTETIDIEYGFRSDRPRLIGIAREATQDETYKVEHEGKQLW